MDDPSVDIGESKGVSGEG